MQTLKTWLSIFPANAQDFANALYQDWVSPQMKQTRQLIDLLTVEQFTAPNAPDGYWRFSFINKPSKSLTNEQIQQIFQDLDTHLLYRDDCDPLEPNHYNASRTAGFPANGYKEQVLITALKAWSE